jgi:hypothetical protein
MNCEQLISAQTPYRSGGSVVGRVRVVNSVGCGNDLAFTRLEREACGWAGCRWRVIDNYDAYVYAGADWTIVLSAPCHAGTSQYRTAGSWDGFHYTRSQPVTISC